MFEWDPAKAAANRAKHGIDLEDAAGALLGLALTRPSPAGGENRFITTAEFRGEVIVVVWTPRAGAIRLISARRANSNEQTRYREAFRRRSPPG